jgi:predicted glutamine amidotransferase
MCRLFGFRSVIPSQVHRSLVAADNALGVQSGEHPDGWGVAFYVDGCPQVHRSTRTALSDAKFHRLSGVVSAETVLAHVRKATHGELSVLNCHPFQHGRWLLAHNGDIPEFPRHRERLVEGVAPQLRRYLLGDTDSEVIFFLFLTELSAYGPLSRRHSIEDVTASLNAALQAVMTICSEHERSPLLTVIVTDGETMVGARGGKELYWSTYKRRCPDRDSCASLSPECEAPSETGFVNHFILSSEPLQGDNVWHPLEEGEGIGVDFRMQLLRAPLDRRRLSVVRG